ncbi:MAG TPA: YccF domain-containing protein [Microthrixaceae bacterium]|nr:YccF domain-containing protein [Microthrixaceae bacterium]
MKAIAGVFSLILNLLWLLLAGVWLALGYAVGGVVMCLTIIGIPFGFQAFKFAAFSLWPFGKAVVDRDSGAFSAIFNTLWVLLIGWWLSAGAAPEGAHTVRSR